MPLCPCESDLPAVRAPLQRVSSNGGWIRNIKYRAYATSDKISCVNPWQWRPWLGSTASLGEPEPPVNCQPGQRSRAARGENPHGAGASQGAPGRQVSRSAHWESTSRVWGFPAAQISAALPPKRDLNGAANGHDATLSPSKGRCTIAASVLVTAVIGENHAQPR